MPDSTPGRIPAMSAIRAALDATRTERDDAIGRRDSAEGALVNLFAQHHELAAERDDWREWAIDADHHPGCSGGIGNYPCKCGRRDLLDRYPRPERADERNER